MNETYTQKRATKYILNYKNSDYKSWLSKLNLLPLMSRLEYYNIMFFVSCWNHPGEHFNIRDFISSSTRPGITTRSQSSFKLFHTHSKSSLHKHFFFNRIPRLWNNLPPPPPPIDITSSPLSIKTQVLSHLHSHFNANFDLKDPCWHVHIIFYVRAVQALISTSHPATELNLFMKLLIYCQPGCPRTLWVSLHISNCVLFSSSLLLLLYH